jgi:hypothetical protein
MQILQNARSRRLLCLASLVVSLTANANPMWRVVTDQAALAQDDGERTLFPSAYRLLALDVNAFQDLARTAPLEFTHAAEDESPTMLLPMPDGSFAAFRIQESPILAPDLAARLPEVKTYRAQGIDDLTATARLDFTPEGFHAFIRTTAGSVYIDPYLKGSTAYYISYWRSDYARSAVAAPFHCDYADLNRREAAFERPLGSLASNGATLRTYRLALAATGEYTQFHGGTVAAAQSAMVTTMNRVNGIYEQDLAVRMTLVNNTAIVFTNAATDPYANDSDDLNANQTTIDALIGSANYDIGHLFGTGGGGVAFLGVVCAGGEKALGLTGSDSPVTDAFDVDYVAHEMGHQFGAEHTFNGSTFSCGGGNRWGPSAYEPGSGSTIMAYAGICGAEDLQPHSDPYFHVRSYDEILSFITAGIGNNCAVQMSTGNTPPTVNAGTPIVIPRSTPFYLTGSASDVDSDSLTYCWEEFDLGTRSPPSADNGNRPLFRSFNPVTTPVRTFPKLSDILANTTTFGELLPTTTRTMNFRLTVRDNRPGGGGVNYSATTVAVSSTAGPFLVTAPNTAVTWDGGSTQAITWNVASTTAAPVLCANVTILLSTDGGNTFPTTLHASTPNDGTESTTIPNIATTTARIRVECATAPFFDISNANFTIVATIPAPTNVIATAMDDTHVGVTWTASVGAVSYEIHRRAAGGSFTFLSTSATTNFTDDTALAGNAYLYAVKAVDALNVMSALSAPDLATTIFFNPTLSLISGTDITELRTAIHAVRTLAGLTAFSYTDATITGGVTKIKTTHLAELRTALDTARSTLLIPALAYTDPTVTPLGTPVRTAHITELRSGVQ